MGGGRAPALPSNSIVILALDARIHAAACTSRPDIGMDCRVKPGNDS